jgi:hypothetical protein
VTLEEGEDLTWCLLVTNTGDTDVSTTVSDPALVRTWPVDLGPGEHTMLHVDAVAGDSDLLNTATVTGDSPGGHHVEDEDTASIDVIGPEIGIAKTIVDGPVSNGDGSYTLTYRLRVHNTGETRLDDLQVTDDMSETFADARHVVVDDWTSPVLTVNPDYNGRPSGSVELLTGTDSLGTDPADEVQDLFVTVTVTPGEELGPYLNTAVATATSPAGEDVSDTSDSGSDANPTHGNPGEPGDTLGTDDPVPVEFPPVDLTVVKTVEERPQDGALEGNIDWGIVVGNDGPGDDPGPITVTDRLDERLTFVSAAGTGWACAHEGQTVTCVWDAPLSAGATTPMIHVITHVSVSFQDETYTNGAHVSSSGGEVRTDNNDSAAEVSADFVVADVPSTLPRTGATIGGLLAVAVGLVLGGRLLLRRARSAA